MVIGDANMKHIIDIMYFHLCQLVDENKGLIEN